LRALSSAEAGTFVLDLSGKPQSTVGTLTFTPSWDDPASDDDMIVAGTDDEAIEDPELRSLQAQHGKPVPLAITVCTGVPVHALTLAVTGS
jgi:hypothetical protein